MIVDCTSQFAPEEPAAAVSMADYDEAEFLPYLDGLDLSHEQASEFVRIM